MASFAKQHANGSYGLEQAAEIALAKASWEQSQAKLATNKGIVKNLNQATKGYSSHPDTKPAATSNIGVAVTVPTLVLSSAPVATATPLNMQLQNSLVSNRMMVKACVKTTLFRRLKFFIKDMHGLYDLREGTVCALIIANCNVTAADVDEYWWADMRKLIVATHTDRRNNVIKNIRLRFNGTL
jgi:hypothetical protein